MHVTGKVKVKTFTVKLLHEVKNRAQLSLFIVCRVGFPGPSPTLSESLNHADFPVFLWKKLSGMLGGNLGGKRGKVSRGRGLINGLKRVAS